MQILGPLTIIIRLLFRNGSDAEAASDILMAATQDYWTEFNRFHGVTDC